MSDELRRGFYSSLITHLSSLSLPPFESGSAFFQERAGAFVHVLRVEELAENLCLKLEACGERQVQASGDGFEAGADGERREAADVVGEGCGCGEELRGRDDAID